MKKKSPIQWKKEQKNRWGRRKCQRKNVMTLNIFFYHHRALLIGTLGFRSHLNECRHWHQVSIDDGYSFQTVLNLFLSFRQVLFLCANLFGSVFPMAFEKSCHFFLIALWPLNFQLSIQLMIRVMVLLVRKWHGKF